MNSACLSLNRTYAPDYLCSAKNSNVMVFELYVYYLGVSPGEKTASNGRGGCMYATVSTSLIDDRP